MSSVAPVFGQDPSSADWLAPRLSGRWGSVTGNLPDGYPAYIRLLHPLDDDGVTRSRRDIAAEFGTRTHPLVQWVPLLGRRYNSNDVMWRNTSPEQGNLDPAVLQLLLGVWPNTLAPSMTAGSAYGTDGAGSCQLASCPYLAAEGTPIWSVSRTASTSWPAGAWKVRFTCKPRMSGPTVSPQICSGRPTEPGAQRPRSTSTPRTSQEVRNSPHS